MFRHVAMFRWNPDATDDARAAASAGLAELPAKITSIRRYQHGSDAGLADTNWDYVIVADFDDESGYLTYRDHQAHRELLTDVLSPIIAERAAVQFRPDT